MVALADLPFVVFTAPGARCLEIDLLPGVLSDIADVEVMGFRVEGEAPGIAQADSPDLVAYGAIVGEGIVGWNRVGIPAIDVDSEHLAKELAAVLRPVAGVSPLPPSPNPI